MKALGSGISSLDTLGEHNPASLQVEFNLAQYTGHNAGDITSYVRIVGLPLSDLGQARQYTRKNVIISGGMSKGLPLANPAQRGPLIKGNVFQSFGNWRGTEQSLDMFIAPGFATKETKISPQGRIEQPQDWTFTWKKDQKLGDMLQAVLGHIMPGVTAKIQVSDDRTAPMDMPGQYQTFAQFSQWLNYNTRGKFGDDDSGVSLAFDGNVVVAFETKPSLAKPERTRDIAAIDLIGQPMWMGWGTVQVTTVLRGDLDIADAIKLPKDFISEVKLAPVFPNNAGVMRAPDSINFGGGTFMITRLQHFGNFRQPDATAWTTVMLAVLLAPE
jgi:hypothetical protein